MREGSVQNMPRKKKILQFLYRYNGFGEMSRIPLPEEN